MGTDIHMILQRKVELKDDTDYWETVLRDIFPQRNYEFFSWLAGVRSNTHRFEGIGNQGLPTDISLGNQQEDGSLVHYEGGPANFWFERFYIGEHSYGWIDALEFVGKSKIPDELKCYQQALELLLEYNLDEYRLVYGFDS